MFEVTVKLKAEKETKNMYRFQEVENSLGPKPVIWNSVLYLDKAVFDYKCPETIIIKVTG
jgi:hypothetical protein